MASCNKGFLEKHYRITFVVFLVIQFCTATIHNENFIAFGKDISRSFDGNVDQVNLNQPVQKRNIALLMGYLPALVISGIARGLTLGCVAFAPSLIDNIDEIKFLRNRLDDMRSDINLQWSKVTSLLRNMQYLNSSLNVLEEQMELLYTMEEDMIVLLDPNIYNKLDATEKKLEEEIKKHNKTIAIDPSLLLSETINKMQLAWKSVFQMTIYTIMYGAYAFVMRPQYEKMANKKMIKWIQSKPDIFGDRIFQVKNLKMKTASYQKYLVKSTSWQKGFASVMYEKKYQRVVRNYKTSMFRSTMILNSIILGLEVLYMAMHYQNCKEKDRKVKDSLSKLQSAEQEMMQTKKNITLLQLEAYKNFGFLAKRLQEENFYEFVNHAYELAKNQQIEDDNKARDAIEKFKIEMRMYDFNVFDYDGAEVVASVNNLVHGMKILNKNFECEKKQIQLLIQSSNLCRKGSNYEDVWKTFQGNANIPSQICKYKNSSKITEIRLKEFVSGNMKKNNKSEICIRNNQIITKTVCKHLKNGLSISQVLEKVENITLEDITFMKNACREETLNISKKVCIEKSLGKTFVEVKNIFKNHRDEELSSIYQQCNLTNFQEKFICESKNGGKAIAYVFNVLSSYPEYSIEQVFNKCKAIIRPSEIAYVCILSKIFHVRSPNDSRLKALKDKYGYETILDLIQNRCETFF